jgi:hypothetical protein
LPDAPNKESLEEMARRYEYPDDAEELGEPN